MFIILSAAFFLFKRPNEIKGDKKHFLWFQVAGFWALALGKGLVTLLFKNDFYNGFFLFFLTNIFSMIIGGGISIFLLKREGLITDMIYIYNNACMEEGKI
jgi:hypothetical protein